MKQRITEEQLTSLERKDREKLWYWLVNPREGALYQREDVTELLSIGQNLFIIIRSLYERNNRMDRSYWLLPYVCNGNNC